MPLPRQLKIFGLLFLSLLTTWLCYISGLRGDFLFDDYANLPNLGITGPINNWASFWRYITSGSADPTGRPIALLSFLADADNWPTAPYAFKQTNLLLQLVNGLLLACLLGRLGINSVKQPPFQATIKFRLYLAAILAASLWMLHPLFVSTTLYIVQREAMLPATFTLLGLLAWLHGRALLLRGRTTTGLIWLTIGLPLCTLLGFLSKANGILLPALALVIEHTWLRCARPMEATPQAGSHSSAAPLHPPLIYRRSMFLLAWLPAMLVAIYLIYEGWMGITHGISSVRSWTLGQRLLTEPRVLVDYLKLLWIPRPFTPGLFNDHLQASTSLIHPFATLPALLAVCMLIAGAWLARKRYPAAALAVLFYFVGQSLESSTVALELYFEHRNYLPAMLMFWPLSLWLCGVGSPMRPASGKPIRSATNLYDKPKAALALGLVLMLALMTHACANLWGNTRDQALLWAKLNPDSPRAQANAAQAEMQAGHPLLAIARLRPALVKAPGEVQLALNLFAAECQAGHVDDATIAASVQALHGTRDPGSLLSSWFGRAIDQASRPPCSELNLQTIGVLLDAALKNPNFSANPGRRQDLYFLQGRVALAKGDASGALALFNHALDLQVRATAAFQQAAVLGSAGHPEQALAHLDHYEAERAREYKPDTGMPRVHAWVLERQHYWDKELLRLRATLQQDLLAEPAR